jgi:hypothetical protein
MQPDPQATLPPEVPVLIPAVSFTGGIAQAVQHRRNLVVAVTDRHP